MIRDARDRLAWLIVGIMLLLLVGGGYLWQQAVVRELLAKAKGQLYVEAFAQVSKAAVLVVIDGDTGRVVSWSDGAHRLTGYTAAEMVNRDIDALVPTRMRTAHNTKLQQSVKRKTFSHGKSVQIIFCELKHKQGHEVPVIIITRIMLTGGKTYFAATLDRRDDVLTIRVEDKLNLTPVRPAT